MTVDQLKQQLLEQLQAADADVARLAAEQRQAELRASFLRGQLDMLGRIQIEERPVYTEGVQDAAPGSAE